MKIRSKLALGFLSVAAVATAAAGWSFLKLQERTLEAMELESESGLVADAARAADESDFSQDPLLLLDALASLVKLHPELSWCRVRRERHSTSVDPKDPREKTDVSVRSVTVPTRNDGPIVVELAFSKPYQARQKARARDRVAQDMAQSAYVVLPLALLLALALSFGMARRLLLLERAVDDIGTGKLGAQTGIKGSDEIARLAAGINSMSAKLEELERLKKTFVASVTHELRSPLAAIESCVRLIVAENGERPQTELDLLRRIESSAVRLGHFVTNLLEMAKIERGKLELHSREAKLKPLLEDAVLFFEPRAKEAGLSLSLAANGDLPPSLRMDPDLVTQVLTNLVSNAIKFTPKGGQIEVSACRIEKSGKPWIECSVRDNGPGLTEEAAAKLFIPFERAGATAQGAGLGLAVSKAILELHGGSIGVESKLGSGTRFYFLLPL